MAMLHAQSFKFSTGSYARTQANLLAYEVMDRMRVMALDTSAALVDYTSADPGGSCVFSGTVAANQQITNDLNCWYDKIDGTLPGASGSITQAGNLFTVTVNWTELAIREQGNNQKGVAITFQPTTVTSVL